MVTVYSTNCPRCRVLEKKLNDAGIEYEVNSDTALMTEKGFTEIPMLETEDGIMNFISAIRWINGRE